MSSAYGGSYSQTPYNSGTGAYQGGGSAPTFYTTTVDSIGVSGEWLQIQFPTAFVPTGTVIIPYAVYVTGARIAASNNGTTWSSLLTVSQTLIAGVSSTFTISTSTAYAYYRMIITNVTSSSIYYLAAITEWSITGNGIASAAIDTTGPTTGALVVSGGVGITNSVNIGGGLNVSGIVQPLSLADNSVLFSNAVPLDFSNNFAITWTQTATSQSWTAVAMSTTGQFQTAVVNGGYIWTSTNYGVTWNQTGTATDWYYLAVSASGQYQVAANGNYIYSSSNYGVSWTPVYTQIVSGV